MINDESTDDGLVAAAEEVVIHADRRRLLSNVHVVGSSGNGHISEANVSGKLFNMHFSSGASAENEASEDDILGKQHLEPAVRDNDAAGRF
jgi:hypothetical protein